MTAVAAATAAIRPVKTKTALGVSPDSRSAAIDP
jgi:hypothetical protein